MIKHINGMNIEELQTKKQALEAQIRTCGIPEEVSRLQRDLTAIDEQIQALEKGKGVSSQYQKHDKLTEPTLKPVNKVESKLDKELQEWEVESTKDGQDQQGQG